MTVPSNKKKAVDVLILGGGPAGLAALLWSADLGMSSRLFERSRLGGQLFQIHNPITNYPGRSTENGSEMAAYFMQSLGDLSDRIVSGANVISFDASSITASLESGETYSGRAAVIATGVSRRQLGVPGESQFVGRGILESGAGQKGETAGKRIAIIGGGDAALENALILSEFAARVYVIHRRDRFSARNEFVSRVKENDKVEFLFDTTVASINGDEHARSLTIKTGADPSTRELEIDLVLIRIGVKPNTEIFQKHLELDDRGYVVVDALGRTSASNVFASGDVANPVSPTISTAVGSASTAVKAIYSLIYKKTIL